MTSAVTSGEAPSGRLLGLGEALRSPVLLGGTVLAFECRRRLFGLILVACGPAAVTAGLGRVIEDAVDGTPRRLFAVGIACLATIALAAAVPMPATCRAVFTRIRHRRSETRRS
jgi:putative peptidoglycan lipid II flippase